MRYSLENEYLNNYFPVF